MVPAPSTIASQPGQAAHQGTNDAGAIASARPWRPSWLQAASTVILFALIWLAYYPSLGHGPRGDQWYFLLETIDQQGFLETFSRTYSFNRTRVVDPGDYQLFRPVLFCLLSAEKAVFGNRFALWQAVGIGLHCLAVFLLLQVLLLARRWRAPVSAEAPSSSYFSEHCLLTWLAYALALFFGLSFTGVEMVIWSHINGYLLFIDFALGAVFLALKVLAEPTTAQARKRKLLGGAFLLVLLGAFTHEIGQFFAPVLGAVLALAACRDRRVGNARVLFLLFASVSLLYQGVNHLDRAAHPQAWDRTIKRVRQEALSAHTCEHLARYLRYSVVQPFFPARAAWMVGERVLIPEPPALEEMLARPGPMALPSTVVIAAGLFLTLRGLVRLVRERGRILWALVFLLPFSLLVLHGAATVLGRMNLRPGPLVLGSNSYYAYLPLLAFLASIYVVWARASADSSRRASVLVLPVYGALLVGLVVLSAISCVKVNALNVEERKALAPLCDTTKVIRDFIAGHRREPGFSLAFDRSACAAMTEFYGIPHQIILFKRYVNNHNPTYVFTVEGDRLVAHRCGNTRAGLGRQIVPDLVKVSRECTFFYFEGWYYAVPHKQDYYLPERHANTSLIEARTLAGAEEQLAGQRARQEDARKPRHATRQHSSPPV